MQYRTSTRSKRLSPTMLIALLACLALMLACNLTSGTPTKRQLTVIDTPLPTIPPIPTNTTIPTIQPSPSPEPFCDKWYKWDQVTLEMSGEVVCVYGVVFSHQNKSRIDFSSEKNSFFLFNREYYYPELSEGICVATKEKVEVFDNEIPFMEIKGGLYQCEPWMLE